MGNTERRQPMKPSQELTVLFCFGHFYVKLFVFWLYSFVKARTEALVRLYALALHVQGGVSSRHLKSGRLHVATRRGMWLYTCTHTHNETQTWSKTFKPAYPIGLSIQPDETGRKGVFVTAIYYAVVAKKKSVTTFICGLLHQELLSESLSQQQVQFCLVLHKSGSFSKVMAFARI